MTNKRLNIALWVVQGLLALAFLAAGGMKAFSSPADLIASGMTMDLTALRIAGFAEVAGALGLILPAALRILPKLTALAAALLALVMALGAGAHIMRGEYGSIVAPLVLGALCLFVAWGRTKAVPIAPR